MLGGWRLGILELSRHAMERGAAFLGENITKCSRKGADPWRGLAAFWEQARFANNPKCSQNGAHPWQGRAPFCDPCKHHETFPKHSSPVARVGFCVGESRPRQHHQAFPKRSLRLASVALKGSEHATQASRITPRALLRGRAAQTSQSI